MVSSKDNRASFKALESLLGFSFKDPSLLRLALVHSSYCNENDLDPTESYERLEFLGDAVLELAISTELYRRFPQSDEGKLTKTRSSLVRKETLADVARRINLADFLIVGRGVETTEGHRQDSVLSSAFEALVAAIYIDQGNEFTRQFVLQLMDPELNRAEELGAPPENPKSRLQEMVQGQGMEPPKYRLVSSEGPDHGPVFTVEVLVNDQVVGAGSGGKKSDAESAAARSALAAFTGQA
ncbi:MAG: ribonuclease III [SAR202 cluster bacterium]|nr:ribonuclease III [SAR202 cluster bacterium]HCP24831.1 ribonuclease III [Dehalococcoidia bacterium]